MTEPRRDRVYLLRLWQADGEDGRPLWRASLQDARTGERHESANLARLCTFLEALTTLRAEHDAHPQDTEL
jgi:hypothetical protein